MLAPLSNLTWADAVDVLFLTVVAYYLFQWFRGTKALRALIGLVVMGVLYSLARGWGLFLTTWVFQVLWQVLVILLLILFQNEIRQVLERVSPMKVFRRRLAGQTRETLAAVAEAVRGLAARRWGGLIVLRRWDLVSGLINPGLEVDALVGPELLLSIFDPKAPSHDGAVLVAEDRIERMGAYLPLSAKEDLPGRYGTRHRAALGLSEACDAVVVVVSEESAEISLAVEGELRRVDGPEELKEALVGLMQAQPKSEMKGLSLVKDLVLAHWPVKVGAFLIVSLTWLILAGQQDFEVGRQIPVNYQGVGSGLKVAELSDRQVNIRLVGPRRKASAVRSEEIKVVVGLWGLGPGSHQITLIRQNIEIPLGLEVVSVNPKTLRVILQAGAKK